MNFDVEKARNFVNSLPRGQQDRNIRLHPAEAENLNNSQRRAFDIIKRCDIDGPIRMIVYGSAGTGKSYLIHCLKAWFGNKCKILAPTGTASFNVCGQTLHSAFRIPVVGARDMQDLRGQALRHLQEDHKEVCLYLIDEVSMIGRSLLGKVDKRMRQAFPHAGDQVFGGRSVVFFGDFGQLYPVMDAPLFSSKGGGKLSDMGRAAYLTVDQAVVLTKVERQSEDSEFRDLLLRLRNGLPTRSDFVRLQTRFTDRVTCTESLAFKESTHVYTKREEVAEDNIRELRNTGKPIAVIDAKNSGVRAGKATAEEAGGLEKRVLLCDGAKIMLTKNISTSLGLCNGSFGTVHSIIYRSGGLPQLPDCVLCCFSGYCGEPFDPSIPASFPVFPTRMSYEREGTLCSREQIPLQLAWSVTVHKEQGATLKNALVSIGDKDFSPGLTYVALSRVKELKHLLLLPFLFQRISSDSTRKRMMERMREDKRIYEMDGHIPMPAELLDLPPNESEPVHSDGVVKTGLSGRRRKQLSTTVEQGKRKRQNTSIERQNKRLHAVSGSGGPCTSAAAAVGQHMISAASREASFDFVPVSHDWMLARCCEIGIVILEENIRTIGLPHAVMRIPNNQAPIRSRSHYRLIQGDGNCFYRAISFAVCGDEGQHAIFRKYVADLVKENSRAVKQFAGKANYRHLDSIERDTSWAADVNIALMAYLLRICIHVYQNTCANTPGQWARYGPYLLNDLLPPVTAHPDYGIYLDHYRENHFNVVTAMQ